MDPRLFDMLLHSADPDLFSVAETIDIQLYRVVRPSGARGRFEAATAAGGLTPFVGREDELRTMTSRWLRRSTATARSR